MTLILLPDMHNKADYDAAFDWIVAKKTAMNIKAVIGTGDNLNENNAGQWALADSSFDVLDAGAVNYVIVPGNHELDGSGVRLWTNWNTYFPQSRFTGQAGWSGGFQADGKSENLYFTFTVGARSFIVIGLDLAPTQASLDWAGTLLTNNSTKDAIIVTHGYLDQDATRLQTGDNFDVAAIMTSETDKHTGEEIWNELVKLYANVRIVHSGHLQTANRREDDGNGGNKVNQMLYDNVDSNPWVRVMKFNLAGKSCRCFTYDPATNTHVRTAAHFFNMTYQY